MSKKEYNMQRGLHVQQLTNDAISGNKSSGGSKEVAQYRDSCPPGTSDQRISDLIKQMKGDNQKIQNAINEMWEDHRGQEVNEWATVKGKKNKKKEQQGIPTLTPHVNPGGRGKGIHGRDIGTREPILSGRGRGRSAPPGGRGFGQNNPRKALGRGTSIGTNNRSSPSIPQETSEGWGPDVATTASDENTQNTSTDGWNSTIESHQSSTTWNSETSTTVHNSSGWITESSISNTPQNSSSGWITNSTKSVSISNTVSTSSLKSSTPNAWARGSPLISSVQNKSHISPQRNNGVSTMNSETSVTKQETSVQQTRSTRTTRQQPVHTSLENKTVEVTPDVRPSHVSAPISTSPGKLIMNDHHSTSVGTGTSPKQYLKLGKWDNPGAELPLQFGSFSLDTSADGISSSTTKSWSNNVNTWSNSNQAIDSTSVDSSDTPKSSQNVGSEKNFSSKYSPSHPKNSPRRIPLPRSPVVSSERATVDSTLGSAPPGLSSVRSSPSPPKMLQARDLEADVAPSRNPAENKSSQRRDQPQQQSTSSFQQTETQIHGVYGDYPLGPGNPSSDALSSAYQQQFQYGMRSLGPSNENQVQESLQPPLVNNKNRDPHTNKPVVPTPVSSAGPQPQMSGSTSASVRSQSQPAAVAHLYQQQYPAPPPPPGMAYNPYNYGNYYQQSYGYYQNPQYPAYSPRQQYPPRGNVPYGVDAPMQGFSNPQSLQLGYQDQLAHQYAGVPQGFGDLGGYLHQPQQLPHGPRKPMGSQQQQAPNSSATSTPQTMDSIATSVPSVASYPAYSSTNYPPQSSRDHAESPPIPSVSSYGNQHYGWGGASYAQPSRNGWNHMMTPQGLPYQQHSQVPGVPQHQQHAHYQRYGATSESTSAAAHTATASGSHTTWST